MSSSGPKGEGSGSTDGLSCEKRIEIMRMLYKQLRVEIVQSIRFQNRVILSEALVIAVIYGLEFAFSSSTQIGRIRKLAALVLPPVIIVSTGIWVAEQSRMMRIGNYLELLENKINAECGAVCLSWENWLRSGQVSFAGNIHHAAKVIGYILLFIFLGMVSLALYAKNFLLNGDIWTFNGVLELSIFIVYLLLFGLLITLTLPILDYSHSKKSSELAELLPSGQRWSIKLKSGSNGTENENGDVAADGSGDSPWGNNHKELRMWEQQYTVEVLGLPSDEISEDITPLSADDVKRASGWLESITEWQGENK